MNLNKNITKRKCISITEFPLEILNTILSFLDTKSLYNVLVTNKYLSKVAVPCLWNNIYLTDRKFLPYLLTFIDFYNIYFKVVFNIDTNEINQQQQQQQKPSFNIKNAQSYHQKLQQFYREYKLYLSQKDKTHLNRLTEYYIEKETPFIPFYPYLNYIRNIFIENEEEPENELNEDILMKSLNALSIYLKYCNNYSTISSFNAPSPETPIFDNVKSLINKLSMNTLFSTLNDNNNHDIINITLPTMNIQKLSIENVNINPNNSSQLSNTLFKYTNNLKYIDLFYCKFPYSDLLYLPIYCPNIKTVLLEHVNYDEYILICYLYQLQNLKHFGFSLNKPLSPYVLYLLKNTPNALSKLKSLRINNDKDLLLYRYNNEDFTQYSELQEDYIDYLKERKTHFISLDNGNINRNENINNDDNRNDDINNEIENENVNNEMNNENENEINNENVNNEMNNENEHENINNEMNNENENEIDNDNENENEIDNDNENNRNNNNINNQEIVTESSSNINQDTNENEKLDNYQSPDENLSFLLNKYYVQFKTIVYYLEKRNSDRHAIDYHQIKNLSIDLDKFSNLIHTPGYYTWKLIAKSCHHLTHLTLSFSVRLTILKSFFMNNPNLEVVVIQDIKLNSREMQETHEIVNAKWDKKIQEKEDESNFDTFPILYHLKTLILHSSYTYRLWFNIPSFNQWLKKLPNLEELKLFIIEPIPKYYYNIHQIIKDCHSIENLIISGPWFNRKCIRTLIDNEKNGKNGSRHHLKTLTISLSDDVEPEDIKELICKSTIEKLELNIHPNFDIKQLFNSNDFDITSSQKNKSTYCFNNDDLKLIKSLNNINSS